MAWTPPSVPDLIILLGGSASAEKIKGTQIGKTLDPAVSTPTSLDFDSGDTGESDEYGDSGESVESSNFGGSGGFSKSNYSW